MSEQAKYQVIGITGGSGSGKTSIIKELRNAFSYEELCIISQDDYYHPREHQFVDKNGIRNFDLPSSVDCEKLVDDLKKLMTGQSIHIKEYVFNNEKATPRDLEIKPAPVIVVEGLFVFHYEMLRALFDCRIFVQAKENLKVIRRIRRDQLERNYPLDDVLYRYEHHVMPSYEKYILPYLDSAHLVINNNESYDCGVRIMKSFVQSFLTK